ncbi:GNAT family N-acetyltransferase [Brevundimonas sp.]|uniref:GNAT family N-acetyltransferase n=2 Tax=Brevundimonas sp. TaxID=1871086 RepID=UPI002D333060|nr:GNAT family N-acetyltransferase [Brevundimonas sp.]HYC98764.1 GNAT family N-acetyltransferase [Brevundimonas sp.]
METSRLRIRPLGASDAEALHAIHELVGHGRAHRSLDELRTLYREMEAASDGDPGWHGFVLELHSGLVIGDVGICVGQPEQHQAEIGYSLHPRFWGAGYASEALKSLLADMFSRRGLHRVVAVTVADNSASRALLTRLGFRLEAHYASAFYDYRAERWVDSVGYALLASEWGAN